MGGPFFIVVVLPALVVLLLLLFLGSTGTYRHVSSSLFHGTIIKQLLSAHMFGLECPQFLRVFSILFEHLMLF